MIITAVCVLFLFQTIKQAGHVVFLNLSKWVRPGTKNQPTWRLKNALVQKLNLNFIAILPFVLNFNTVA